METILPAFAAIFLFLLERAFPLRKPRSPLAPRLFVNSAMAALTVLTALVLVRPETYRAINLTTASQIGIIPFTKGQIPLPNFLEVIATFLLLDLSFYYWHRLNHRWRFLWRFHNTHHLDPDMDVSTAFRFHFAEVALSVFFRIAQCLIIGPDMAVFLAYDALFRFFTFFHHSNLRLTPKVDQLIEYVFVTPRMHGMHHSNFRCETDSNYSVVFSLWDRLHGSFTKSLDMEEVTIGVPGYSSPEDNQLGNVLMDPFKKQRNYWQGRIKRPPN